MSELSGAARPVSDEPGRTALELSSRNIHKENIKPGVKKLAPVGNQEVNMADQTEECILFLRTQLVNQENYVILKFGVTENAVSWPTPDEVKKNLDQFSMEVYTSVQQHLVEENDDSTKPIRDLCNYYLELLADETRADEMEDLENQAIMAKDNEDETFSIVELTEEMQLLLSKVAD